MSRCDFGAALVLAALGSAVDLGSEGAAAGLALVGSALVSLGTIGCLELKLGDFAPRG